MARRNRKKGRPQAVKRVWVEVIRRPEEEIDQRQLSLALIAMQRGVRGGRTCKAARSDHEQA